MQSLHHDESISRGKSEIENHQVGPFRHQSGGGRNGVFGEQHLVAIRSQTDAQSFSYRGGVVDNHYSRLIHLFSNLETRSLLFASSLGGPSFPSSALSSARRIFEAFSNMIPRYSRCSPVNSPASPSTRMFPN